MDMTGFKFGKPEPRLLKKKAQKLDLAAQERQCRADVKRRDKGKCRIPGCKEAAHHHHHIVYRSRGGKWRAENICLLCASHHRLVHDGLITISGNANEELIIHGDRKFLEFKL